MHISEIIRTRRLEQGLTQEQMARQLGVSTPAVSKWERGASLPDITVIPAIARLLRTDANTLLSFEPHLTREQNLAIQRETDRLVRENSYEAGFGYAREQMQKYPASDEMACVIVQYLDGALSLHQVPEPERFRPLIDETYERLARSSNQEVRNQAHVMLYARAMQEQRFDDAQRALDELPDSHAGKRERQAALHLRRGDVEQAAAAWEARAMELASDALSVFAGLIEIALLEERIEDARTYAERMQEISNLLGMPTWMGVGSLLTVAVADKDTAETARLLDVLLRSLSSPTDRTLSDPIYRHTNGNDLGAMMSCAIELLFNEVKGDDAYHFFRESDAYRAFIAQWTPMTP